MEEIPRNSVDMQCNGMSLDKSLNKKAVFFYLNSVKNQAHLEEKKDCFGC